MKTQLQTVCSRKLDSTVPLDGTAKRPWGLGNASMRHLSPTFKLAREPHGKRLYTPPI